MTDSECDSLSELLTELIDKTVTDGDVDASIVLHADENLDISTVTGNKAALMSAVSELECGDENSYGYVNFAESTETGYSILDASNAEDKKIIMINLCEADDEIDIIDACAAQSDSDPNGEIEAIVIDIASVGNYGGAGLGHLDCLLDNGNNDEDSFEYTLITDAVDGIDDIASKICEAITAAPSPDPTPNPTPGPTPYPTPNPTPNPTPYYEDCDQFSMAKFLEADSRCFIDDGFSRWGWTIGPFDRAITDYCGSVWAGAGACNTGFGFLVGTLCVSVTNSGEYTATWTTDSSYDGGIYNWDSFQFYIGDGEYPLDSQLEETAAPSQYTQVHDLGYNTQSYTISGDGINTEEYWFIGHAYVCGVEDDERRRRRMPETTSDDADYPTYSRQISDNLVARFAVNDDNEIVWQVVEDGDVIYEAIYVNAQDLCDDDIDANFGYSTSFSFLDVVDGEDEAVLIADVTYYDCDGVDNEGLFCSVLSLLFNSVFHVIMLVYFAWLVNRMWICIL